MTLLEETDIGEGGIALIRTNRESTNEAENVLHQRFSGQIGDPESANAILTLRSSAHFFIGFLIMVQHDTKSTPKAPPEVEFEGNTVREASWKIEN